MKELGIEYYGKNLRLDGADGELEKKGQPHFFKYHGWMDGWVHGWVNGRTDGRTDGWMESYSQSLITIQKKMQIQV